MGRAVFGGNFFKPAQWFVSDALLRIAVYRRPPFACLIDRSDARKKHFGVFVIFCSFGSPDEESDDEGNNDDGASGNQARIMTHPVRGFMVFDEKLFR